MRNYDSSLRTSSFALRVVEAKSRECSSTATCLFGPIDHRPRRCHLVIGACRRGLNVDNHGMPGVNHVVEAIAKLDPLVYLCSPRRTRIHWRDHLRQLAIRVRILIVEARQELSNGPGLTLRRRPVNLIGRLAVIAAGVGLYVSGINGKAFALYQAILHAGAHHGREHMAQDVAVTEATVAID